MKVYLEEAHVHPPFGLVMDLLIDAGPSVISMSVYADGNGTLSWTQARLDVDKASYFRGLPVLDGSVMDGRLRSAILQAASLPAEVY